MLELGNSIDLGLWPDEGFFLKYRRGRGSYWAGDPLGLYVRSELPIPNVQDTAQRAGRWSPLRRSGMVAGIALPVLARARESARRVSSANNMAQIGKAMMLYADDPAHGDFPTDPAGLFPKYVNDARVFTRPGHPASEAGYTYIVGPKGEDGQNIVLYENVTAAKALQGRNILYAAGSVEHWGYRGAFLTNCSKATEQNLKAKANRNEVYSGGARARLQARIRI